jgi:prepilin-type N-terminal cleavage/methylation domain-containing protein
MKKYGEPREREAFLRGFTLIELLVVVAIIAIIVSLVVVNYQNYMMQGRSVQRVNDIKHVQIALENFYRAEGLYPYVEGTYYGVKNVPMIGWIMSSSTTYLNPIPSSPEPWDDNGCPNTNYSYTVASSSYRIDFCIGTPVGDISAGQNCATPEGVIKGACETDSNNW